MLRSIPTLAPSSAWTLACRRRDPAPTHDRRQCQPEQICCLRHGQYQLPIRSGRIFAPYLENQGIITRGRVAPELKHCRQRLFELPAESLLQLLLPALRDRRLGLLSLGCSDEWLHASGAQSIVRRRWRRRPKCPVGEMLH